MISLHKNDKIIILIAVVVIIFAGIGIAAYNPSDSTDEMITNEKLKPFKVTWSSQKISESSATYDALKNNPYTDEITLDQNNVINVTFSIDWVDDYTYGILRSKGEDTFQIDIIYNGITKSAQSTGNGSHEITFQITSIPRIENIDAEDEDNAMNMIKSEYYSEDPPVFEIEVSIQTGERFIRPLKFLRDKGNSFDLQISYEYFKAHIAEEVIKDTSQGNDFDELRESYFTMIIQSCYGGRNT